jgi:hypothetical protein
MSAILRRSALQLERFSSCLITNSGAVAAYQTLVKNEQKG